MSPVVLANTLGEIGMPEAVDRLDTGCDALDAIEAGIRTVEASAAVRFVGRGGAPNLLGEVECDSAIMDGVDFRVGAVGGLRGYLHAISVARQVMDRLPHAMIVGEGASLFAAEIGAEPAEMLTDQSRADYQNWLREKIPPEILLHWPNVPLADFAWKTANPRYARDTTIFLALDSGLRIAGGTSSSGWAYKYPGRVGDSPIIGAGLYADSEYGACACTHSGEVAIRAHTAGSVVLYMKRGASVRDACLEAIEDLQRLRGGYLGPLTIHAMNREGEPYVVSTLSDETLPIYWIWNDEMSSVECRKPELVKL